MKIKKTGKLLEIITVAVLIPTLAEAATATATGGLGITPLFLILAYMMRRQKIGGWLFIFYLQLYLGFLLSFVILSETFSNLNSYTWDNTWQYALSIINVVSLMLAQYFEVFAATRLLIKRTEKNVNVLKLALLALAVLIAISITFDLWYFESNPVLDYYNFVIVAIWNLYFMRSIRVRKVFIENTWGTKKKVQLT
jgi:Protein of unknown function (DUF2569)